MSVAVRGRGRGYGARLFDHAVLRARNRRVDTIVIHALSENVAMLKIVRNAGALIEHTGGDSEATLKLPPENFGSVVAGMVEQQIGELDYRFKQGARRMDTLLGHRQEVTRRSCSGRPDVHIRRRPRSTGAAPGRLAALSKLSAKRGSPPEPIGELPLGGQRPAGRGVPTCTIGR